MDNIQFKVVEAICKHKDLISDRNKFKGMLADYLVDDKVHLNVLMNAYDEKFPLKIKSSSDKTLVAIQYIKILAENYGISEKYAKWSIETWCAVLGYNEVSEALKSVGANDDNGRIDTFSKYIFDESEDYELGLGTFCAGVDFPAGTVSLKAVWGDKDIIYYEISDSVVFSKEWTGSFVDKTYIKMEPGQFIHLELKNDYYGEELESLTAKKVAD